MSIWFGGDYNPEQWPREVWDDDVRLMNRAGVSMATVGVFSWSRIEPRPGEYDFEWLDDVLERLHAGGVKVDLATATASPPPWLTHNHPEVLPMTESGVRLAVGARQQFCPSSPVFREHAARLVEALAARYAGHPALALWHIHNEYGCHNSPCYCDVSAEAFRHWLRRKYGSIEALNDAWGTAFWSQIYGDFAEVYPPRTAPTWKNPTHALDYSRFSSDELLDCFRMEHEIVRRYSPDVPITTNFMGFFKKVDYWAWAPLMDVVSHDSYPDQSDELAVMHSAMERDLMRSLGGGKPWYLMEQAVGAVNFRGQNGTKLPGQQRLWSHQAVARGADAVMYFQWRQSRAGAEKFFSALVPHSGTDTRVWQSVEQLGGELSLLDDIVGVTSKARVAMVFDWDSWWSIEEGAVPTEIDYIEQLQHWYRPFYDRNLLIDFVRPTDDLSSYEIVVVPCLFVASSDALDNLSGYAAAGGTLLVTYQSAITTPDAHLMPGGYLGSLQESLGVWIEEFAPLARVERTPHPAPIVDVVGAFGPASARLWSEYVRVVDAEVVATFSSGPLTGWPAVTSKARGSSRAWYVATMTDAAGTDALVAEVLRVAGVAGAAAPIGVEVTSRGPFTFYLNHSPNTLTVEVPDGVAVVGELGAGVAVLAPQDVLIVRHEEEGLES